MRPEIRPEDDSFHPIAMPNEPFWNESGWFNITIPEKNMTGFFYYYHRPNMRYTVGGVALWDPSGAENYDCRYYDWGEPFPLTLGADVTKFSLPNGTQITQVEPNQKYLLRYQPASNWYEGKGCKMDLVWEANQKPHNSGLPKGADEWGSHGHYEQPGRLKGVIELDGEVIHVDHWSQRDRSWGPRRLAGNPRGLFPWAIHNKDHAFHVLAVPDLRPEEDSGIGTTERIITGWYLKDGIYGDFSSGKCQVTKRGDDGAPLTMTIDATDHLGRVFHAEGRARNMLNWHGYPFLLMWWAGYEWSFDGITAWGELQDYWPLQHSRELIRSQKHKAALRNKK